MTTRTELLEILANGENSGVEFTGDDLRAEDLAKELVAFSNLEGGMVLLGVEDDGTVTGLVRRNLKEWVMNTCRERIRPAIVPFFDMFRGFRDTNDIAIVRVTRGYGVHALWHDNTNRYLMRVGTQSREASQEELGRLVQHRGSMRAELQPVSGATLANLDRNRLRNYFGEIRQQDVPADEDAQGWQSLLVNTQIMAEDGVTVGGMLLFGKTPNHFLPHAGIDAVAYAGTERDDGARERATLRGPMAPLLGQGGNIIENGLVEQAMEFVQRYTGVVVEEQGNRRSGRPVYPSVALREAIVNALIHRDYMLTSTNIELAIFSDRLEIVSPGRLPNGMTLDRMRAGTRSSRNQLLNDVMRDYRCPERMRTGVPRNIIGGMYEHSGTEPDLIEKDERFIVRLLARAPE